jgi:hypothetical protein
VLTKIFSYAVHFRNGVLTAEVMVLNETKKGYDLGGEGKRFGQNVHSLI